MKRQKVEWSDCLLKIFRVMSHDVGLMAHMVTPLRVRKTHCVAFIPATWTLWLISLVRGTTSSARHLAENTVHLLITLVILILSAKLSTCLPDLGLHTDTKRAETEYKIMCSAEDRCVFTVVIVAGDVYNDCTC